MEGTDSFRNPKKGKLEINLDPTDDDDEPTTTDRRRSDADADGDVTENIFGQFSIKNCQLEKK